MEFGFVFPPGFNPPREYFRRNAPPSWKQQLLAKGWGYAVIVPTSYQADNGAGLTQGIIGLVNKGQPRKANDWGDFKSMGLERQPGTGLPGNGQGGRCKTGRHRRFIKIWKGSAGGAGL